MQLAEDPPPTAATVRARYFSLLIIRLNGAERGENIIWRRVGGTADYGTTSTRDIGQDWHGFSGFQVSQTGLWGSHKSAPWDPFDLIFAPSENPDSQLSNGAKISSQRRSGKHFLNDLKLGTLCEPSRLCAKIETLESFGAKSAIFHVPYWHTPLTKY